MTAIDTTDPRTTGEHVRRVSGAAGADTARAVGARGGDAPGDVVLAGVVHHHPASQYRVQTVVEAVEPATLALELPPLAIPLYEEYASDRRTPPAFGGEMSAAVQAAATDRVVGIDGPSRRFLSRLARTLWRERASADTARSALASCRSVGRHAVVCRLAAGLAARTGLSVEVDSPPSYDVTPDDDPAEQAASEREQVRAATSAIRALEPSAAARTRSRTRDEHMADRLASLSADGDVVAVVGIDHLDPVTERLTAE